MFRGLFGQRKFVLLLIFGFALYGLQFASWRVHNTSEPVYYNSDFNRGKYTVEDFVNSTKGEENILNEPNKTTEQTTTPPITTVITPSPTPSLSPSPFTIAETLPPTETPTTAPTETQQVTDLKDKPVYIQNLQGIVWLVEGSPVPNCPVVCHFDRDGAPSSSSPTVANADAIFYTGYHQANYYLDKSKVNLLFASESFHMYAHEAESFNEGMGTVFDASVNYHLETDDIVTKLKQKGRQFTHLTITYSPFKIDDIMEPPLPFSEKKSDVLVSLFVSNCGLVRSSRNEWIRDIMAAMPVDSFGRCYNNKQQESLGCFQPHYDGKLCVIRKYKFYLAFENSVDDSYVTEKYWHGKVDITENTMLTYF